LKILKSSRNFPLARILLEKIRPSDPRASRRVSRGKFLCNQLYGFAESFPKCIRCANTHQLHKADVRRAEIGNKIEKTLLGADAEWSREER